MGDRPITKQMLDDLANASLPVCRQAQAERIDDMCAVNTEAQISRKPSPYWGQKTNEDGSLTFKWFMSPQEQAERAKEAAFIDRIAEAVVAKLKAAGL